MIQPVAEYGSAIDAIAFAPDGRLVVAAREGVLRIGDAVVLHRVADPVVRLAVGPQLVCGTAEGALLWVDWSTGGVVRSVRAFEWCTSALAVRADGLVVAGGENDKVKVFTPDGACRWVADILKYPYAALLSQDGRTATVASWSGEFFQFEPDGDLGDGNEDDPAELSALSDPWHPLPVFDLALTAAGGLVFAAAATEAEADSPSLAVGHWVPGQGTQYATLPGDDAHAVTVNPSSDWIAVGTNGQRIHWLSLPDLALISSVTLGEHVYAAKAEPKYPDEREGPEFPSPTGYHWAIGPHAVFSMACEPDGSLIVGTAGGHLLRVPPPRGSG